MHSTTPASNRRATGSRNDPCGCGSGRRFKACHGAIADGGGRPTVDARASGVPPPQRAGAGPGPADRAGRGDAPSLIVCCAVNGLGNVLRAAASDKILADSVGAGFADALPRQDFWVAHIYAAAPQGMTAAQYVRRKVAFYAALPVAPALLAAVDAFAARHDLGRAVGVHVRHGDNLHDALKRDLQLNTPLPAFAARLATLAASGRRILLCSDNRAVLDDLRRQLPPEALILADAAISPLLQPLYEMLLLSRTASIVGSYASTFSYEACFFRGIDLECFEQGEWRRHPIAALAAGVNDGALNPMAG